MSSFFFFFSFTYLISFLFCYFLLQFLGIVKIGGPWTRSMNGVHGHGPYFDGPGPWIRGSCFVLSRWGWENNWRANLADEGETDLSNIYLKAVNNQGFNQSDHGTRFWYHGTATSIERLQAPSHRSRSLVACSQAKLHLAQARHIDWKKHIHQLSITNLKIPSGERQTTWLFRSMSEELN